MRRIHQRRMKLWSSASPVASAKPRRPLHTSRANGAPPEHELILLFNPAKSVLSRLKFRQATHSKRTRAFSRAYSSSCLLKSVAACLPTPHYPETGNTEPGAAGRGCEGQKSP